MARRWVRRRVAKIDAGRLSYFRLDPDEQPVDTFMTWVPTAWPKLLPFGEQEPTIVDETFLSSGMLPLADELAVATVGMFGVAIMPLLCVTLITDRRLLLHPVPAQARAKGPGDYGRFAAAALGVRAVPHHHVKSAEAISLGDGLALSKGVVAKVGILLSPKPTVEGLLDGPAWPAFANTLGAEGLVMTVTASHVLDYLFLACRAVGINIEPPEFERSLENDRSGWRPMRDR